MNDEPTMDQATEVTVRTLRPEDLDRVVRIDALVSGGSRGEFYQRKLDEALRESWVVISQGAEIDGTLVGFVLGRLYCGEFGVPEQVAIIDSIGVDPAFGGRRVASAMVTQLARNLQSLRIEIIRTEVDWESQDLLRFFASQGFKPSQLLSLELRLTPP